MPEMRSVKCPNCAAPMEVPLGEVELDCGYCSSRVRFVPGRDELEVVRAREELKSRERVTLEQERLRRQLEHQEAERWRQTAARVAIAAVPLLGRSAGRAVFDAALRRSGGCLGCGCIPLLLLLIAAGAAIVAAWH